MGIVPLTSVQALKGFPDRLVVYEVQLCSVSATDHRRLAQMFAGFACLLLRILTFLGFKTMHLTFLQCIGWTEITTQSHKDVIACAIKHKMKSSLLVFLHATSCTCRKPFNVGDFLWLDWFYLQFVDHTNTAIML